MKLVRVNSASMSVRRSWTLIEILMTVMRGVAVRIAVVLVILVGGRCCATIKPSTVCSHDDVLAYKGSRVKDSSKFCAWRL
jgi:hypothetical protein